MAVPLPVWEGRAGFAWQQLHGPFPMRPLVLREIIEFSSARMRREARGRHIQHRRDFPAMGKRRVKTQTAPCTCSSVDKFYFLKCCNSTRL